MKMRVFVATSLDGFIAREDGSLDWLPQSQEEGEDHGFGAFLAQTDLLLLGRKTMETVLGFGEWPYGTLATWVVSQTLSEAAFPEWVPKTVRVVSGDLTDIVKNLREEGYTSVYADGGQLVQALLALDAVDELVLTRVPVLLGSGRSLFGALPTDLVWTHEQTQAWPNGLVQSRYKRTRI